VQMPLKRITKRKATIASSFDSSASDNDFIASPRAGRSTRRIDKTPYGSGVGSSS
jgi:hypothetical protein